jgi:hypothetical protein
VRGVVRCPSLRIQFLSFFFSRLNAEKQQLAEQLDKFSMEKMREGIEANAKTMVDAAKHELVISNLEKDLIRLKMEADRIAQAHELEEKSWRRTESEYKESITRLSFSVLFYLTIRDLTRVDNELKQHQELRAKFEGEFFGLKEKSSTATQETYYLKEVNAQLQNNSQRFETELAEKKLCILFLNFLLYFSDFFNFKIQN